MAETQQGQMVVTSGKSLITETDIDWLNDNE
jgi:hypothetical protein